MRDRLKRGAGWALCGFGGLVVLFGVWAIGSYVWGVIDVLDEADQSWMFWGLAVFFIGIGASVVGAGLVVAGWALLKRAGR